jgi:hypothetical protein
MNRTAAYPKAPDAAVPTGTPVRGITQTQVAADAFANCGTTAMISPSSALSTHFQNFGDVSGGFGEREA